MEVDFDTMPAPVRARLLLALALAATAILGGIYLYLSRPHRWPSVQGTVLASYYFDTAADHGGPDIQYAYEVGGRRFTSKRLSQFAKPSRYCSDRTHLASVARAFIAAHPAGSPIEVRYDPNDPSTAFVLWTMNVPSVWVLSLVLLGLWGLTGWTWILVWSGDDADAPAARQLDAGGGPARAKAEAAAACWRQQYVRAERVDEPAQR